MARPRSRLQTERGEWISVAHIPATARALAQRVLRQQPEGPWIVPSATSELKGRLRPSWRLLEIGSGRSTVWYAKHTAHVISLENDPAWHAQVLEQLRAARVNNADVRLVPTADFGDLIRSFEDDEFDVVIMDGGNDHGDRSEGRVGLTEIARDKVRVGGLFVLDNSDRPLYRPIDEMLAGWSVTRYVGLLSSPVQAGETSIYLRAA